ncbi:helix-turn-helix domain-containing protein [Carnobacterium divergens]|uniref:helix-turn-helix domain-containing protein n=1 Tax=Carnobacterium divergens TaxID=2748 RepID=UPI00288C6BBE|nr:helix-turn-helix transcriptional regulator [Carnobacterium divergens]MDT2010817.1 helix-turn-helix domain-containing protein [Carnobacterium divergens]
MIKIQKPDKKLVGQRIKSVKEDFGLSLTELGMCLDLKKTTLSSYIQGYCLPPLKVIEELSNMSGRPTDWFYYGSGFLEIKEGEKKLNNDTVEKSVKKYRINYIHDSECTASSYYEVEILEKEIERLFLNDSDFVKCLQDGKVFIVKKERIISLEEIE